MKKGFIPKIRGGEYLGDLTKFLGEGFFKAFAQEENENNKREKPTNIMYAETAANKAMDFVRRTGNFPFARLVSVKKRDRIWYIRVDVGVVNINYRLVKIDDRNGKVIGFSK